MCRSGDLRAERSEERIEGVLGPWRIWKDAVHSFPKGRTAAGYTEDAEPDHTITVVSAQPFDTAASQGLERPGGDATADELDTDTPSEASELLSESVRSLKERAEALVTELERLEGRLEFAEIQDLALREALRRETERSDGLRSELEAERARRRGDS